MSHFTVMAITTKDSCSLEDNLAKYDENLEVDPYIDETYDELVERGKRELDADQHRDEYKDIKALSKEDWCDKHGYGSGERREESYKYWKKLAEKVDKYVAGTITDKECHDYALGDDKCDKDGNRVSSYNPDSKWDWYSIGGRWGGELILKEGAREDYDNEECVDSAKKKDIDWAKMNSIAKEEKERAIKFWKYYVEGQPYPGTDEEKKKEFGFTFYKPEYYKEHYKTLEKYIKRISAWHTYAVVDADGNWYEPGQMGWFGMSDASDDASEEWEMNFYEKFIENLPEDAEITIVDCHI